MAPKKTATRKRTYKKSKHTDAPTVSEMNALVKSRVSKRDRALMALATVSALGVMGAACGTSNACKARVTKAASNVGKSMQTAKQKVTEVGAALAAMVRPAVQDQVQPKTPIIRNYRGQRFSYPQLGPA
jgi:hypothetical protein